ncbi:MAG: hypothetical protein EBR27_13520, partial [Betaproteobacteria bacterium]|nr:hypothetical protein [Betaproteobacteria bacterium]
MNAAGQITEYQNGNAIRTVKEYDPQTQRLKSIRATTLGQVDGNVLNQSYSFDALGNLLTREDTSPGVGTSETFAYDTLNRLTIATVLGGSVSPPTSTQVMYDARGNIMYKSDVGRYWYDGARPNLMTQVTLETAPGATVALTGTRRLSYAYDNYRPSAQTVNAVALGNGNLEYTVSQDSVNGRHTVRYESYTSFNMPREISVGNFASGTPSASYSCPGGSTLSGNTCIDSQPATPNYGCADGFALVAGPSCSRTVPAVKTYSCGSSRPYYWITYLGESVAWCGDPMDEWNPYGPAMASFQCSEGQLSGETCLIT